MLNPRSQVIKWATFSSYCRQRTDPVWPVRTLWCCCRVWKIGFESLNLIWEVLITVQWVRILLWFCSMWTWTYVRLRYLSVPHLDGVVPQARDYLRVVILKTVNSFENWDWRLFLIISYFSTFAVLASAVDSLQVVLSTPPVILNSLQRWSRMKSIWSHILHYLALRRCHKHHHMTIIWV